MSSVLTWFAMPGREIPVCQRKYVLWIHTLVARLVNDTEHILLLLGKSVLPVMLASFNCVNF
jgi:hypothetical protein